MDDKDTSSAEPCCPMSCGGPKCCWIWGAIGLVIVGGVLLTEFLRPKLRHNDIAGTPTLKADGNDLKATVIVANADALIVPGKNVLWCSTFQLVWNEGCRHAGGDIHLKDEPPLVASLNKKIGDAKDVDADSCLVMSGMVQDGIVKKIRQELDRKFQGQADPDLFDKIEAELPSDGWVGYAYLFRELPFKYPFKRFEKPLLFASAKVASFGVREVTSWLDDINMAEQVAVLDYRDANDFVLELEPQDTSERVVLAKVAPAETLQGTIKAVQSRVASTIRAQSKQNLTCGESIVVPVLNFDLLQAYGDLCNKSVTTAGPLKGTPFVLAMQSIRFRLDERGAILKSEAGEVKSCDEPEPPRQFVFDKPFLILLERKDAARPYFALWVDNAELLVPFK
jgi:hypothetical protein